MPRIATTDEGGGGLRSISRYNIQMLNAEHFDRRGQWLVFTDLDGTLLDHASYSHAAADGAMARLRRLRIPCIFTTSKTRLEVLRLREECGNEDPFIVENGGAVMIPAQSALAGRAPVHGEMPALHCHDFGASRSTILQRLQLAGLDTAYRWRGFAAMTVSEIADHTGLDETAAAAAAQREYCEPVLWQDTPERLARFRHALTDIGLTSVAGGRFLHLLDAQVDKGRAMRWLCEQFPAPTYSIGLGDSGNDVGLLQQADIAVLVRSRHQEFPAAQGRVHTIRTHAYGPQGWAEAIQQLLDTLALAP